MRDAKHRPRVSLILPDLHAGGAQRVMSVLANTMCASEQDVSLITLASADADFFAIDPRVRRIGLGLTSARTDGVSGVTANFQRIRALRAALLSTAAEAAISFVDTTNVLAIIASRSSHIRILVSERIHPGTHQLPVHWQVLRSLTYRHADAVVMQTSSGANWARRIVPRRLIHMIPNPIADDFRLRTPRPMAERSRLVVAAGRLVPQKGFDLLIRAFAASAGPKLGWSLAIFGDGPEAQTLARLAHQLQVSDRVLVGQTTTSFAGVLADASIFALSSRFEGFPNVLAEAMASGCATIATDCLSGPSDLIDPGISGLLVEPENVSALSLGLDELFKSLSLRVRLARAATGLRERLAPAVVTQQWLSLLAQSR